MSSNVWDSPWHHCLDVCRHFRDAGWSVTAYTCDAKAVDAPFLEAGIDRRHSPLHGWLDIPTVLALARDLREEQPETIVHVQRYRDAYTVLAARKLARRKDIRVVSTRHTVAPAHDSRLHRRVYRNLDAQIFTSEACGNAFLSRWRDGRPPFDMAKTHVMRASVNLDHIVPLPEPTKGACRAVYHGSLREGKGLETLIKAVGRLKGRKIRLRICGDGRSDYIDSLRRLAQQCGAMESIDWLLRHPDPDSIIDDSHFGVQPITSPVALGISNLECMAHARPHIYTAIGAPPEYMRDGVTGLSVPLFDDEALAAAMLKLAENPGPRVEMGRRARLTYERRLSWQSFAADLEALYSNLRTH